MQIIPDGSLLDCGWRLCWRLQLLGVDFFIINPFLIALQAKDGPKVMFKDSWSWQCLKSVFYCKQFKAWSCFRNEQPCPPLLIQCPTSIQELLNIMFFQGHLPADFSCHHLDSGKRPNPQEKVGRRCGSEMLCSLNADGKSCWDSSQWEF